MMEEYDTGSLNDPECEAELDRLFPQGLASEEIVRELAPEGWEKSALVAVFHPSPEQVFQESLNVHRKLRKLRRKDDERPLPPEPTFEAIALEFRPQAIEPEQEVRELLGMCLWDVLSDNHEVVAPDGRLLDLGSFRRSGEFLADFLNRHARERRYDYLDFFMGTIWVAQRADLGPVYRLIFRRLKGHRLDWVYHFPKLHLVDFRPLRDALRAPEEPEWTNYSPSEAFAKEQEEAARDREIAEMREHLEEGHREAVAEALKGPPPKTVLAYRDVYGRWPRGWPPV